MVNDKSLNFEMTTSSVLSVLLLIYGVQLKGEGGGDTFFCRYVISFGCFETSKGNTIKLQRYS